MALIFWSSLFQVIIELLSKDELKKVYMSLKYFERKYTELSKQILWTGKPKLELSPILRKSMLK